MVYFVIKYRRKGKEIVVEPSSSHNTMIEILWSVLPSFILLYIFWAGAEGFFEMRVIPDGAEEIQVEAFQFGTGNSPIPMETSPVNFIWSG